MGQTRMFRDRVVSMEQTLEGGEKHLPLLAELCREALPELALGAHSLDHERDLLVMDFAAPDGAKKRICWTRMVLFDAERIPTLTGDPAAALRAKIVDFLRAHAARTEIVVTFRHLEEGWVDTPEPRRDARRRRRGGRGAPRGPERGGPMPDRRPQGKEPGRGGQSPSARGPAPGRPSGPAPGPARPRPAGSAPAAASRPAGGEAEAGAGGKKRRRFRRRRRGGRGPGAGPPGVAPGGGGPGA